MSNSPPLPHPDSRFVAIACAVVTISDTRTPETDRSGQLLQQLLRSAGHRVVDYEILPDDPNRIGDRLIQWGDRAEIEAVIFAGGTGIAPRDTTYDALEAKLDKVLPGFGELFRSLSYSEIGSRAIASRAIAGTYHNTLIFSLPGSVNAVRLAIEQLILPELIHLVTQLNPERPRNT
ncbi:MAG: MogA/MoaB family molybdenum cofactor biosynthesis protein [Cyanobacteriota bacterium]|nr:MogA/MoaB family molybdenum cofactor biosynthesis protein [Cyanobacteriota bacterium]